MSGNPGSNIIHIGTFKTIECSLSLSGVADFSVNFLKELNAPQFAINFAPYNKDGFFTEKNLESIISSIREIERVGNSPIFTDEGKKQRTQIAFENIERFSSHGNDNCHNIDHRQAIKNAVLLVLNNSLEKNSVTENVVKKLTDISRATVAQSNVFIYNGEEQSKLKDLVKDSFDKAYAVQTIKNQSFYR